MVCGMVDTDLIFIYPLTMTAKSICKNMIYMYYMKERQSHTFFFFTSPSVSPLYPEKSNIEIADKCNWWKQLKSGPSTGTIDFIILLWWLLLTGYNYAAEIICILFCSNPKNPWSCTTRSKKRSNDCWESHDRYCRSRAPRGLFYVEKYFHVGTHIYVF